MTRVIQYVGFAGHHNLGDDVIREVFADRVGAHHLRDVPIGREELLRDAPAHLLRARGGPLLLGGGTLLGREAWRRHLERAQLLFRPSGWEMLGAGVEDPEFSGTRVYTSASELAAWKALLPRFRNVTVRGPRSREILAEHGIDSTVVGDPALLKTREPKPEQGRDIDILVNVACGEDQWGGLDLDWTPGLVAALGPFAARGARIGFVSMDPGDDAWNLRVADALGVDADIQRPSTEAAFFDLAERSRVVLGTRLHCNILAAACGTPTVSLEYRPKCRDFMRSVGAQHLCHRIDRLEDGAVTSSLESVLADWDAVQGSLVAEVEHLRQLLRREVVDVCTSLGFPTTT